LKQVQVAAVSYLNTKPLLFGVKRSEALLANTVIHEGYPSKIAQDLLSGKAHVGLVPVAILPQLSHYKLITDFCIGATQAVASVCLFSKVPIEQVTTILLDYQSRSSINLCRVLLRHYWQKEVTLVPANEQFIDAIDGTTAGVIIGDRALTALQHFPYVYDLAEHWIAYTGLPFVFAAWVCTATDLPQGWEATFNAANAVGFQHLPEVIAENTFPYYDLYHYYTQNISYQLDAAKLQGLNRYLALLETMPPLPW